VAAQGKVRPARHGRNGAQRVGLKITLMESTAVDVPAASAMIQRWARV
jgi:hypothetical protein